MLDRLERDSDLASIEAWLDANQIGTVRVCGMAIEPLLIGKYLHRRKFLSSLPKGPAVVEFVFGADRTVQPYLGFWGDWRQETLGDVHLRPDLSTMRIVPDRPGVATCMADFIDVAGEELPMCGRSVVRRLTDRVAKQVCPMLLGGGPVV